MMQRWTNFFDAIYLINLESRSERLIKSLRQLHFYEVPVQVFEATHNKNGAIGLRDSMIVLFIECLERKYERVLIFEDDINVLEDLNTYMPLCLSQLPNNFDLLYLGGYIIRPFLRRHSENLIVLDKILTTHAIVYSKKSIEILLPLFVKQSLNKRDTTPIDMVILNRILNKKNSYITYPLLVSQLPGRSDITGLEVDYEKYIEKEYASNYKKLIS